MIDIHCHILYGIDDGPSDLDGSLAMARLAAADGVHTIVATPHVTHALLAAELIAERAAELNARLVEEGLELEVLCGGECLFNLAVEDFPAYTLNGGSHLLVECPHTYLPLQFGEALFAIQNLGLVPVIAHPERNPSIKQDPQQLLDLVERGALAQITAGSLTGDFGAAERACARYLLKKGAVYCIASDGHSADWRPPLLSAAVKAAGKIVGREHAQRLVKENPESLIAADLR